MGPDARKVWTKEFDAATEDGYAPGRLSRVLGLFGERKSANIGLGNALCAADAW